MLLMLSYISYLVSTISQETRYARENRVVSRVMRKFVLALVEICRMGAGSRPLVTFQRTGCKGSRAAVRRSSCP